ncbi:hypothetical protein P2318_32535 [Myxococcaceae bacterium GXIMD 01537]
MAATTDTGERGRAGVVASLVENPDGSLRLLFDDLDRLPDTEPPVWRTQVLFTFKDYDKERVLGGKFSKEELAEIGENVLIRLVALSGLLK